MIAFYSGPPRPHAGMCSLSGQLFGWLSIGRIESASQLAVCRSEHYQKWATSLPLYPHRIQGSGEVPLAVGSSSARRGIALLSCACLLLSHPSLAHHSVYK